MNINVVDLARICRFTYGTVVRVPTDTDKLAYIAGLVDGEGCIDIHSHQSPRRQTKSYQLRLTISNTSPAPIEWLVRNVGGSVDGGRNSRQLCYNWNVLDVNAENLLRALLPFLVVKHDQAVIGLEIRALTGQKGVRVCNDIVLQRECVLNSLKTLKVVDTSIYIDVDTLLNADKPLNVPTNSTELAYFAGIFDGEGHLEYTKNISGPSFYTRLNVTNTDLRLMQWISQHFGGRVSIRSRVNLKWKPTYNWRVGGEKVFKLLLSIHSYSLIKQDRIKAILALNLCKLTEEQRVSLQQFCFTPTEYLLNDTVLTSSLIESLSLAGVNF